MSPTSTSPSAKKKNLPQASLNKSPESGLAPAFACIDMGTNSFHMVVCRAQPDHDHFEVISREREAVPFFRRSLANRYIDASAEDSALRILKNMKEKALKKGAAHIAAVATSAVRESNNGTAIMHRVRKELGIDAKMISGKEEARLIYLGVIWRMPRLKETFCVVDIGGGSTELIVGDRFRAVYAESYKLGAARLSQRFFADGKYDRQSLKEIHEEVKGMLRPAAVEIANRGGFSKLIGTSGTIAALVKLDRDSVGRHQAELQGWHLPRKRLADYVSYIEYSCLHGHKMEGIASDRSQTILAGSIVLLETMKALHADELIYCNAALREGVVVDHFLQTGWLDAGLTHHSHPRQDSVNELLQKYKASPAHAQQVAQIASQLFSQSQELHKYPESARHLLWSAAMLHDVGTFIGRKGHHKHSYYLIRNAGLLGHSEEEVELIATIARYHRGNEPRASHAEYDQLPPEKKKLVSDLSAILRIAEACDRSHQQAVERVKLSLKAPSAKDKNAPRQALLTLIMKGRHDKDPELWAVAERKLFFERAFNVKLDLAFD